MNNEAAQLGKHIAEVERSGEAPGKAEARKPFPHKFRWLLVSLIVSATATAGSYAHA
jgi:hypothetical protein